MNIKNKLDLGMTQADIDSATSAWKSKLKSSLMRGDRTHVEILIQELQASVCALEILENVTPIKPEEKLAKVAAGATPLPKSRPTTGPLAPAPDPSKPQPAAQRLLPPAERPEA